MASNRKPPVDWDRLKQIQDENQPPRMPFGSVLGVLLLGLSLIAFFIAFYCALDPTERIEPVRYFFYTSVAFGFLIGSAGVAALAAGAPGGADR